MNININGKHNKDMTDLVSRVSKDDAITIISILAAKLLKICKTTEVCTEAGITTTDKSGITSKSKIVVNIKIK